MTFRQTTPPALSRAMKVYKYFFIGMTFIILLIFFEPTFRRLAEGIWVRGRFNFAWTLSLDIHAIVAYGFLVLLTGQCFFGYQQVRYPSLKDSHAKLGQLLFFTVIPLLILVNLWTIFDRGLNIPQEQSVIFRGNPFIAIAALIEILLFLAWYTMRSFRALKRGDILTHVDSILGAFMSAGMVAIIRFLYLIFWTTRGGSPFSAIGMFFLAVVTTVGLLTLAFLLAGRFRQNSVTLLAVVIATALIAVLGAGHYTILDL